MAKKLALIGYGGMADWHCTDLKKNVPEIDVIGAYDVRPEAMEKAVNDGLHAYNSMEELLSDPQIDLVLIATPNDVHKDISIAALRAGKNVVCEKPITMNAAELEEIIAVKNESGKLFSIHHNRRWDRDFLTVRKMLDENVIGTPYYIESRVQGSRRAMHGWRSYAINGGGMVLDWGSHLLDQLLLLINSPVISVDAHVIKVFSDEVDDNFKAFLQFESGVSALIDVATNCFELQPRWHVSCEDGTAIIHDWSCNGEIKELISSEAMEWEDEIVYTAAGPTRMMAPRPEYTVGTKALPEVKDGDYGYCNSPYFDNIVKVLDGKAELQVTAEQALRSMKLVDLIFKCGKQGHGESCRI